MPVSTKAKIDDEHNSDAAIGARLALIRIGFGMTQASFASSIGVSQRSYFHYEKGTRSLSTEMLRRLRAVHGLNLMWVMFGEGLPRDGEDSEALSAFVEELSAHLSSTKTELPSRGYSKIVSRWFKALRGGQRVEMRDVEHWVDLLRE